MRPAWLLSALAPLVFAAGCRARNPSGELVPPPDAPPWEARFAVAFDDDYTREPINLAGRAPNDVRDQQLFASRMGHAAIVALVTVEQVWGRGRYRGKPHQYVDVTLDDVLLGELPRGAHIEQLVRVSSEDELPGALQGMQMIFFVRWAEGERPAYHHHLMPADPEVVAYIDAMVDHARQEGVLDERGQAKKRGRKNKKKRKKADGGADIDVETDVDLSQ